MSQARSRAFLYQAPQHVSDPNYFPTTTGEGGRNQRMEGPAAYVDKFRQPGNADAIPPCAGGPKGLGHRRDGGGRQDCSCCGVSGSTILREGLPLPATPLLHAFPGELIRT